MFMHPNHTPLEGQMKVHGYAIGGAPPSPSLVQPPPPANPSNPPPIGSTPQNVADNIPAKLSEGEFVWPADVVKFYGMDWIQKQMTKAKEGMLKLAQSGMIKGNGPPVPNTPEPDPNAQGPAPEKPIGAAAGGFFAGPGHPDHVRMNADGGYQSFADGGLASSLALPTAPTSLGSPTFALPHIGGLPSGGHSPISGKIPHNTGIVRSGIRGPIHNGTSLTHVAVPHLSDGGFMSTDNATDCYSAGGMPGGIMTPYAAPTAAMTQQPDPYAAYQPKPQQGMMSPYS